MGTARFSMEATREILFCPEWKNQGVSQSRIAALKYGPWILGIPEILSEDFQGPAFSNHREAGFSLFTSTQAISCNKLHAEVRIQLSYLLVSQIV